MIKKVLIASLFLGGGIFFIKKILPLISSNSNNKDDLDLKNLDDTWEEQDRLRLLAEQKLKDSIKDQFGTSDISKLNLNQIIGQGAVRKSDIFGSNFGIPTIKL